MGQCDYWWISGTTEWCDLTGQSCACGGSDATCRLKRKAIVQAMEEEERISLNEAWIRARKRRSAQQAT